MSDYLHDLILRNRGLKRLSIPDHLSTSEELFVLLGIGTPGAIKRLGETRFPTIPDAWKRLDRRQREELIELWEYVG